MSKVDMQNVTRISSFVFVVAIALSSIGCRGKVSSKPPVHPVLNMDFQKRFEAQEANAFFADDRAMRPLVPGTVARGFLREDVELNTGRTANGALVKKIPMPITAELMARGQNRFDIFCTPCHGYAGDGKGIISTGNYGMVPAPTYHDDRLRNIEDGHFFDVITNGIRTMPSYGYQIAPEDRWAIVAYIRALQRSQNASAKDVPAEFLEKLAK